MILVAFALQAAAVVPPPQRFSILVPVADQPCARPRTKDEVVVCADPLPAQALPLPGEAVSTRPVPVNRDLTGMGALNAEATPCAARVGGCPVGLDIMGAGTALVRGVQKLVSPGSCCEAPGEGTSAGLLVTDAAKGVGKLFCGKPDRTNRVAIPLDDPTTAGRVLP